MITARIIRKDGRISEVTVKGHSGYAEEGSDIVCAAVSAVVQTALMGVLSYAEHNADYKIRDGYLHLSVPTANDETDNIRIDAIMETMLLGLKDVETGYASFVKVEEK